MNKFYITSLLCFALLVISCGGKKDETDKERYASIKQEIKDLKADLGALEEKIKKEDPDYFGATGPKTITITVDTARVQKYQEYVDVQGSIASKGSYLVSPEMGGIIVQLNVDEGDRVKRGQLIASLDDSQIKSSISEIETGLDLARDVYERRKKLWDQNIGSELEFLQSKNNVESLEKKLESVKVQLGKTKVYAPVSGLVEVVNKKQGELGSPGMPIVSLMDLTRVQIVADVAENFLKSVRVGKQIEVFIPALDLNTTAKITKIGSLINPANRTFKIEADISNKGGQLKPNLIAMIKIKEYEQEKAVLVATNLIKQDMTGDYLFTVNKEGTNNVAKRLAIEKSRSFDGYTLVDKGLKGGELIVAEGKNKLGDGDYVKIQ